MGSFQLTFVFFWFGAAFKFRIDPEKSFCFQEDLLSQTLIIAEASCFGKIELKIDDPSNSNLYLKTQENHTFSWSAFESGIYKCCISNKEAFEVTSNFELKKGISAKDYSQLASLKNLKGIQIRLQKLEDQTVEIHKKMKFLREREESMRNTNSTIHSRVIIYSILTISILLLLATLQITYLKRFFRSKKLI